MFQAFGPTSGPASRLLESWCASAEQGHTLIPRCPECGEFWLPADEERWHCHVVDDGPDDELVFYCPDCAVREFGA